MKLLFVLVLLIAGCATPPQAQDTRAADFGKYNDQINAMRDKKEINFADGQKKKWQYHRSLWPDDPYSAEFFTYTIMLAERVDRGELQESEYQYLGRVKGNEIQERVNADQSRRARDAAAIMQSMPAYQPVQIQPYQMKRPTQTRCFTDGLGNTNCTTY